MMKSDAVLITPELKRIMQQGYLDQNGFWQVVPHNDSVILRFHRARTAWHILGVLPVAAGFGMWGAGFWWVGWRFGIRPVQIGVVVMLSLAAVGIFLPAIVARTWDVVAQWRRGPWLIVDAAGAAVELPRQNICIASSRILWSVLHSEHNFRKHGKSQVTELMLILLPENGERSCLSVSAGYGRKGFVEIDRKAQMLADATRSELTRSGYPPTLPL